MQPRLHVAAYHPSTPFGDRFVTISPCGRNFEAVSLASPGTFKCRVYADCYAPEQHNCLPFSSPTMQNDPSIFYPCYEETSDLYHSESTSDNAAAPAEVEPVSTLTHIPTASNGWSPADVAAIGNDGNSLTAFPGITEEHPRVAHTQAAWESTPPAPLMGHDYSFDTHQRPWLSTAETEHPPAYTDLGQSNLSGMQPNRSQVPSDANVSGAWSYRAGDYHAVETPVQPTLLLDAEHPSRQTYMPTSSYSSTSQLRTVTFDGVPWMAQSLFGQVPSLSHHRRRFRRSYPYPERVICPRCQKPMRPQSLKRHIREVHDRVKRHVKLGFRGGL